MTRPHLEIPTFNCQTSQPIEVPPGTTSRLVIAPLDILCTLTRVNIDNKEVVPVGRSYHSKKWEAVAGPYTNIFYDCNEQSCDLNIPELEKDGDVFELRGFARNKLLTQDDEAARFFEQATFGVTQLDLKKMRSEVGINENLQDYFTKWIKGQMYDVKETSHRAVWRERTSPFYTSGSREGRGSLPCDKGSIWRGISFLPTDRDKEMVVKKIETNELQQRYALEIDGRIRTVVDRFILLGYNKALDFSQKFKICKVGAVDSARRVVQIYYAGKCRNLIGGNPVVSTKGMMPPPVILSGFEIENFTRIDGKKTILQLVTKNSIESMDCNMKDKNYFISVHNGDSIQDLIFEPHLVLESNLLENPIEDGGKNIMLASENTAQCANAPRTFLNEGHCRLSKGIACVSEQFSEIGSLVTSPSNLKTVYKEHKKIIYAITGLRVDRRYQKSPCSISERSRWIRESGQCVGNVHNETAHLFLKLFQSSNEKNPYMRDVNLPRGKECHPNDRNLLKMEIYDGQNCWKVAHPDHLNVYDFTAWGKNHPGNMMGFNPIRKGAKTGKYELQYPESHDMSRWNELRSQFPYVGRLGDSVKFRNLPYTLRTKPVAGTFDLVTSLPESEYTVVCGSPFESSNTLSLSAKFELQFRKRISKISNKVLEQQKRTVWTMIATSSNDQLRQRVAWTLSQIFALSPDTVQFQFQTEPFLTYYDIFVRNAFNNYRDILKEVAFSPMMAQMLSYLESKSTEFIWSQQKQVQFADENFAREIMQLFSIGLEKLNENGTPKIDGTGSRIATYSNDDITEYARLWTGFTYQEQRGNIEAKGVSNTIDPMALKLQWRDQFPKMGLDKKYIGDNYALCSDFPSKNFLRRGAHWRLLGNNTRSDLLDISRDESIPRLDPLSPLFHLLCKPELDGQCAFPGIVDIAQNLPCRSIECDITELHIVQVHDSVYYEYVKPPCVNFLINSSKQTDVVVDKDGKIALTRKYDSFASLHSLTYFRVDWETEFPSIENSCGGGVCEKWGERCLCRTAVEDVKVFDSLPTKEEILAHLHIGALPPYLKNYMYARPYLGFAMLYSHNKYDTDTTFKVKDEFGRTLFLRNMKSKVIIIKWDSDLKSSFAFRNAPSFYGSSPEPRDAIYETEAGLDHYFYHDNTAPFLAIRFLQRFGISNPSPRFVRTVSRAFKTGKYEYLSAQISQVFGSGKYGDLSAMVASILLDSESRDSLLDFDSSFGSIREPLMKVISLMRSMDFSQTDKKYVSLYNLHSIIGQMAHDIPSVFSFFLPEYSPPGPIAKASLVSPEAMLSQNAIGLINGMISLIDYGMTNCFGGFGNGQSCDVSRPKSRNIFNLPSSGHLTYVPKVSRFRADYADAVIQNLATMLTSGRLNAHHRELIKQEFVAEDNQIQALRTAQRLMILSPEFHQTGFVRDISRERPPTSPTLKTCKQYKAVIHILLLGGCDSFNMLVPHSQCKGGKDMYAEYNNVRGSIALEKATLLPINATSSNQVCSVFGIHEKLPFIKELYDSKELTFLAGIGVMSAPVNKSNYQDITQTQLFAHNKLQAEISRLDPYQKVTDTALLGRLADVLSKQRGNKVQAFAVDSTMTPIEGKDDLITKAFVNSEIGFQSFHPTLLGDEDKLQSKLKLLNGMQDSHSSMFAETWSSSLHQSLHTTSTLAQAEKSVKLKTAFPYTNIGRQLELISKMIGSKDCRGSNKDIFYMATGKFDHHSNILSNLDIQFGELNDGLESFVNEMKSLPNDVWKNIAVVVSSDFGRTLTANSKEGSDHGWSGNGFMFGGSINGGKILGSFPEDLTEESPLDIGRGRLIPTMPFESSWHSVTQWLNLSDQEIEKVLPNIGSFPKEWLLNKDDIFISKENQINPCTGEGDLISCVPIDEHISQIE